MLSLRARLVAGVLALSAAGLIALAAVTYAEQRSFLLSRTDRQVSAAALPVEHALDQAGAGSLAGGQPFPGGGARGPAAPGGAVHGGAVHGGAVHGGAPPLGGPGGGPALNLPPGTYGQRRTPAGKVLGHIVLSYGQSAPAAPRIPARIPIGRPFTVASVGTSGLRYRAYARRDVDDALVTVVAVPLRDVDQTLNRLLVVEGLVIAGVLAALGATAFLVVRLGLAPLRRIEAAADQIAAGDLSRRVQPATARTEVGRLGRALNGMLQRLEQAFSDRQASEERLRQFLADASHELRTPLASIRGYAELFRMGAAGDPAEIETAMRRVEQESQRMGVLVEELLALARLDEAPALARQPVDMTALAADAVQDARARAPRRTIELHAPAAAVASGEPHRLRQVLANLMANALAHTPEGTPIEVAVAQDRDSVTVSVRDHGPGLPEQAEGRVFERFWRAQGGRGRGRAGAGLGLAIAQGVVRAHGGQIGARNAPGGGALFCFSLPKAPPPAVAAAATAPATTVRAP
jgi:two-component system, OmpR family, sensor kinase